MRPCLLTLLLASSLVAQSNRYVIDRDRVRVSNSYERKVEGTNTTEIVIDVTFQLPLGTYGPPLQYAELARILNLDVGERGLIESVREAVLTLRGRKGMVLDPADHDTWSAGSFFTNPVVPAEAVPDGAPTWPQPDGTVKTSAAWLARFVPLMRSVDLTGDLGRIRCPMLTVVPDHDPISSMAQYEVIRDRVPDVTFVVYHGLPHNITDAVPDRCAEELHRFLLAHR